MSNYDPEEQLERTQNELIEFAVGHMITIHVCMSGIGLLALMAVGALDFLPAAILVCVITFPLPLMVAPMLGTFVYTAFRSPLESSKQIVRVLIWIFELSLFGWILLFVLLAR
jgi:hypothetical protein